MLKQILPTFLLLLMCLTTNAQNISYNYDYNYVNKIARLWIDFDIIAEYDFLENKTLHKDFTLQDGYIFSNVNDSSREIGFFNNEQLIVNKETYEMKIPAAGKIAVRKKGDKKWIRVKQTKNSLFFIENAAQLPEIVQFWAFAFTLQRDIFYKEKRLYENASTGINVEASVSF